MRELRSFCDEAVRSLFTAAIAPLRRRLRMAASPNCDLHRRHPRRPLNGSIAGASIGEDRWVGVRAIGTSKGRALLIRSAIRRLQSFRSRKERSFARARLHATPAVLDLEWKADAGSLQHRRRPTGRRRSRWRSELAGRLKRSQIGLKSAAICRMSDKVLLGKALRQILHLHYESSG